MLLHTNNRYPPYRFNQLSTSLAIIITQSLFIQSVNASDNDISQVDGLPDSVSVQNPETKSTPASTLATMTVYAEEDNTLGQQTTSSQDILEQQINSQQDLVRYNPEISVAEIGRYGTKGFTIRGVDGNRVAMNVDGVALPDVEVNEVFTPYGYVNDSRFSADIELMNKINLQTGADGVASGSGSLGGAVNYQTKDPEDLLLGNYIGDIEVGSYAKVGYTSKNEELMTAVGLAAASEHVESLVNYVHREGHELKNYSMQDFDKDKLSINYPFSPDEIGTGGIFPDPSHYTNEAVIGKLYFKPTDEHKFGIHASFEERENQNRAVTRGLSYGQRLAWDKNQREVYGISYDYAPEDSKILKNFNSHYQKQQVLNLGDTFVYYGGCIEQQTDCRLAFNEYRPIYQDTDTLHFSLDSHPIIFSSMPSSLNAEHNFSIMADYSKRDYDPYMISYSITDNKFDGISTLEVTSPDIKTDVYNIALTDKITLSDKAKLALGVRYDNYTRKPYFHPAKEAEVKSFGGKTYLTELYNNGKYHNNTTFDNFGWSVAGDYQFNDTWQGQYKASTGFLVPSINQMYSAFSMFGNYQKPNLDLKAETSINQEIALNGNFKNGAIRLRGFHTKYDDFIDTVFYEGQVPSGRQGSILESINLNSAETQGISLGGDVYLDQWFDMDDTVTLNAQVSYATDSTSQGTNLLATQPLTGVLGLDYYSSDDKYGLHTKLTYIDKKKARDTKKLEYNSVKDEYYVDSFLKTEGLEDKLSSAVLLDVYGSMNLNDNITLNAGVYNLLNEKYIPWDSVRQMATTGINNMIKDNGIQRYSAPGTNYGISLTFEY